MTLFPAFASTGRHRRVRNWGARAHETVVAGLPAVVLENELVRLTLLVGKGADLLELLYKPLDLDLVWLAPSGPRDLRGGDDPLGRFLDAYPGGWQEVLPSGGAPSTYLGAAYGQHGEVHLLPWDYALVGDDEDRVELALAVRGVKLPYRVEKSVRLAAGEPGFAVRERLANESEQPVQLMWGQHITFGRPFLVPGTRISLPEHVEVIPHEHALNAGGRRVAPERGSWPVVAADGGGTVDLSVVPGQGAPSELVYLTGFGADGWYELVRPDGIGLRVEWDAAVMPYLWLWQELGASRDYPWWGRLYTIGLEPFSSYPTDGLAEAVRRGTALELAPGEVRSLELSARVVER